VGIARGAIGLLAQEAARQPFGGRIVTLGRQSISATRAETLAQLQRFKVAPRATLRDPVDDTQLFAALGFDSLESIDCSDYEAATHVIDLNAGTLPDTLRGRFDTVLDSGTLEHVFHVPNALKAVIDLAKVGGRVMLLSPSSNHFDHGFYMFSPTLFHDYFSANGLRIETSYVVRYSPNPRGAWRIYEYRPRTWDDVQIGGLDHGAYLNFFVATKTAESASGRIPQQTFYAASSRQYEGSRTTISAPRTGALAAPASASGSTYMKQTARRVLERVPGGIDLGRMLLRGYRRSLVSKRKVARL
jgi:hypothetical protein